MTSDRIAEIMARADLTPIEDELLGEVLRLWRLAVRDQWGSMSDVERVELPAFLLPDPADRARRGMLR
jgi:hypothetical protein